MVIHLDTVLKNVTFKLNHAGSDIYFYTNWKFTVKCSVMRLIDSQ